MSRVYKYRTRGIQARYIDTGPLVCIYVYRPGIDTGPLNCIYIQTRVYRYRTSSLVSIYRTSGIYIQTRVYRFRTSSLYLYTDQVYRYRTFGLYLCIQTRYIDTGPLVCICIQTRYIDTEPLVCIYIQTRVYRFRTSSLVSKYTPSVYIPRSYTHLTLTKTSRV